MRIPTTFLDYFYSNSCFFAAATTLSSLINETFEEEFGQYENYSNPDLEEVFINFMKFSFFIGLFKDVFLGGIVIIIESFTIYTFLRFKKLRSKQNVYILNLCCLDLISQWKAIVDFLVIEVANEIVIIEKLFCSIVEFYKVLLMIYFTICFFLALDWFVVCIRPYLFKNKDFIRIIAILSIHLMYLLLYILILSTHCFSSSVLYLGWAEDLLFIIYLFFLFGIISLFVLINKLNLKKAYVNTSYHFDVAVIIIFSFLPMIIYHLILLYFELHLIIELIFLYTMFIPQILAHIHFVIVLFVLYKNDIEVRNIFVRHFRALEDFRDDQNLSRNMENEDNTYVHADNFGSVEDNRRLSEF